MGSPQLPLYPNAHIDFNKTSLEKCRPFVYSALKSFNMKEKKHPGDEKSRHLPSTPQHRRQMSGMDQPAFHGIQINIRSDPFQHRIPSHLNRLWQESRFRKALSRGRYRALRRYHRLTYAQRIATILGLILCCLLLLSHVGFFSGQKYDNLHQESHENSSPPPPPPLPPLNEIDLLEKVYPEDGRGQATAILLNWSRLENMKIIIDNLCQYDMFQSIMVWNNNGAVNLTSTVSFGFNGVWAACSQRSVE